MSRLSVLTVLALAAYLGSCAPSFPTAPDLQPVLQAYENPTVEVGSEIMAVWADKIEEAAQGIEDSEIFEQLLNVIIDAQQDLESSTARTCKGGANNGNTCTDDEDCPNGTCGGDLVLGGVCNGGTNDGGDCAENSDCPGGGTCAGGVTLPSPTGSVRLNYICPGWDPGQFAPGYLQTCKGGANDGSACTDDADCPDGACVEGRPGSENGSIDLFMTIDSGGIGRVVWGTADQCRYLLPNEGDDCEADGCSEASYDGGVALDLGDDWFSSDIESIPVTFVVEGTIGFDGEPFDIKQSFRVILAVESALEILVDIGEVPLEETFNYIFAGETQLIRDVTGVFGCSLEDSLCFDLVCDGGTNDGNACIDAADCPEGTCVSRERFSW